MSSRAVGGSIRVVRYSLSLILVVTPVLVLAARSRRPDSRIRGSQEKPGRRAGKQAWSHAAAAPAQRAVTEPDGHQSGMVPVRSFDAGPLASGDST